MTCPMRGSRVTNSASDSRAMLQPGSTAAASATGKERADIRDEPHQGSEDPPQERARNADRPEPERDRHPERGIEAELREKIPTEAAGRIVHRGRGAMQIVGAEQADHA